MKKETKDKIIEEFNKNLEEREELFYQIQDDQNALEILRKKPDVVAYLYLEKHLEEVKERLNDTTDDIAEYALRETYSQSSEEPFVWLYDYYYMNRLNPEAEAISRNVCRDDSKGTHRVYLGLESLTPMNLTRESAFQFEQVNEIIVLEEYNNNQDNGLTPEIFNNLRKEYFKEQLKQETKTK